MINRKVTQVYDGHLRDAGLRIQQFSILAALGMMEAVAYQAVALSVFASRIQLDRTTLARNLAPLERDELVRIETDEDDRRVRLISLTGEGRRKLEQAYPLWERAQSALVRCFGAEHWRSTLSDLKQLADCIH